LSETKGYIATGTPTLVAYIVQSK